ncbi:uncharacterized protein B0T15DRAFT_537509 [Chaetomium strumarium]|uniref:Uncharacterized protein n=1 Tax=Chaetomium strumarium TaxID=1170767 RepID=A0AAJ0M0S5_9PEZI|nr:hypothetical protein B0T15DRAFT_537509 [Chaetomium strumarium]
MRILCCTWQMWRCANAQQHVWGPWDHTRPQNPSWLSLQVGRVTKRQGTGDRVILGRGSKVHKRRRVGGTSGGSGSGLLDGARTCGKCRMPGDRRVASMFDVH